MALRGHDVLIVNNLNLLLVYQEVERVQVHGGVCKALVVVQAARAVQPAVWEVAVLILDALVQRDSLV